MGGSSGEGAPPREPSPSHSKGGRLAACVRAWGSIPRPCLLGNGLCLKLKRVGIGRARRRPSQPCVAQCGRVHARNGGGRVMEGASHAVYDSA